MERTILINGEPRPHMECTAWTGLVGVAYLPSTVIPVGRTRSGLPVGLQVVGPFLEDRTALRAAQLLHAVLGEWEPPPLADLILAMQPTQDTRAQEWHYWCLRTGGTTPAPRATVIPGMEHRGRDKEKGDA